MGAAAARRTAGQRSCVGTPAEIEMISRVTHHARWAQAQSAQVEMQTLAFARYANQARRKRNSTEHLLHQRERDSSTNQS